MLFVAGVVTLVVGRKVRRDWEADQRQRPRTASGTFDIDPMLAAVLEHIGDARDEFAARNASPLAAGNLSRWVLTQLPEKLGYREGGQRGA